MIEESQKTIYQQWWFILFLVFLGIGIFLYSVIHTEKTETDSLDVADTIFYKKMEKEELKEKMMQNHKNPEVIAAEIIMKNFGTTYIEKENAVVSSRFESGILETIALEERIISTKTTRHSFLYNTVEFMKVMKSQEEVTQATLIVQAPLTDRYGNVENGDVMIVLMSRETLNKINFNNFNAENLSTVADSYWEHPALSAE